MGDKVVVGFAGGHRGSTREYWGVNHLPFSLSYSYLERREGGALGIDGGGGIHNLCIWKSQ